MSKRSELKKKYESIKKEWAELNQDKKPEEMPQALLIIIIECLFAVVANLLED